LLFALQLNQLVTVLIQKCLVIGSWVGKTHTLTQVKAVASQQILILQMVQIPQH